MSFFKFYNGPLTTFSQFRRIWGPGLGPSPPAPHPATYSPVSNHKHSEWSDARLNATSVLQDAYGRNVLRRMRYLPFRRDEHKYAVWLPNFIIYRRYGAPNPVSTAALTDLRLTGLKAPRRGRPAKYRLKADAQLEAVEDCQMESARFPFDTTQCIVYLSLPWLRGSTFSPSAPGLPSWYKNAERPSSNVTSLSIVIHQSSLRRDELSDDEEWRHRGTGVLCKARHDTDETSVDCYFLMRYERISEKYIYPWLATTNILAIAAIALTYKGSDPGEHYSLGAASLVPCALFLFQLKEQVRCCVLFWLVILT